MTRPASQGVGASRRLLARLRDVMAGSGSAQARLDKIVRLIAAEMVAEVCSCYVARPGDILELFATVGLNPSAVHRTRLRVGEGLVGEIAVTARPLATADALSHPNFAYRPETGEDPYQSLMGVPILRGGKVRGVLVIQNQQRRQYSEEEVETFQTIAMVVAELVSGGELLPRGSTEGSAVGGSLPARLGGIAFNGGIGSGLAVLHQPVITIREMVAENPAYEEERLVDAIEGMHRSIDDLLDAVAGNEGEDILETYRMFAEDRGWLGRMQEAIRSGLTAEAAVQRVQNDMRARMAHVTDPYLRERLQDFDDLANRLLMHLSGRTSAAASGTLPDEMILVARQMGPAELLDYDRSRLRGLVLEEGSQTSHVSVVARALDIPIVGRCQGAMETIDPFDLLVVDGDNAQVFVRPAEDVQEAFQRAAEERRRLARVYAEAVGLPARTLDGVDISIHLNAGLLLDLDHLDRTGAAGVGLYRTEIPFMVRSAYPDVTAQTGLYADILGRAGGRPVVFRTLDVGGDKRLPYFPDEHEENPALGWRAIRIGLDRPAMLRLQLRAMVRAASGRPLSVMFPMLTTLAELDSARALLVLELDRAKAEGRDLPRPLSVGAMIEVPSLLWQIDEVLSRVDFVAVGSNDLLQYLFAADRGNPRITQRYDTLSPVMLKVLGDLAGKCRQRGVPLSLCGEMAGRPLEAMVLVGLGFRRLSMVASAVGPIKSMIRSLDCASISDYLNHLKTRSTPSVRGELRAFALDHGVQI